ncbi:MAG: bifunctional chorismate mutase/prephenate dehydrogenase [Myxococcales bacterium]|nr:bifunctional chorismate mutase/prephenate dehydrogenase [Myxococcales bacterium]
MADELRPLRDQIDEIDQQLVDLLAQRLERVAEVGRVKERLGLPIYVPGREAELIAKRRQEAQARGLSPDCIEDVLRRVIRESYASEHDAGFKCLRPDLGSVVLVGGYGRLGQLFAGLFKRSGYEVKILGEDDWAEAKAIVSDAGLVIITVPIRVTEAVIAQLPPLPPDCVLADVTSIKTQPIQAMLTAHPGPVVGLHPMFGPDVPSLAKQLVAYCYGRQPEACRWLVEQMSIWGARAHEVPAAKHDEQMALIQALRHFTSFAYGVHLSEENPDLKLLMALSSPIYRLELMMVGRLFAQDPELYADIILSSPRNTEMIQRFAERLIKVLTLLENEDRQGFVQAFESVRTWFGEYAERFLAESRTMLSKANDAQV